MKTDLIKIEFHKFTGPNLKRPIYRVELDWTGCGSIDLTEDFTNKRDAERAYRRIIRVSTSNHGMFCVRGFIPMLKEMKSLILGNVIRCKNKEKYIYKSIED